MINGQLALLDSFAIANRQSPKVGALYDAQYQKQANIKKLTWKEPDRGQV